MKINKNLFRKISFGLYIMIISFAMNFIFQVHATSDMAYNSNNNYVFTTNINDPITIEDLITEIELTALDEGVDISDQIHPYQITQYMNNVINQPDAHTRQLGNFLVTFRVYDTSGNYTDCVITVKVIDNTKPVVDETASTLSFVFSKAEINNKTIDIIANQIVATDNHDYQLTKEFYDDEFDINTVIGFEQVAFVVRDSSNNETIINIELDVIDDVGPQIAAAKTILTVDASTTPLEFDDIVGELEIEAYDLETSSPCAIYKGTDNYTANCNKPGVYLYELRAKDNNNNETIARCYIEVIDENPPVFYLSSTKVTFNTKTAFDLEEAERIIRSRKLNKKEDFTLCLVSDQYNDTFNDAIQEEYTYTVRANYEDGSYSIIEFLIEVLENKIQGENNGDNKDTEKPSFFQNTLSFFKGIGLFIYQIMKWPIQKVVGFLRNLFH